MTGDEPSEKSVGEVYYENEHRAVLKNPPGAIGHRFNCTRCGMWSGSLRTFKVDDCEQERVLFAILPKWGDAILNLEKDYEYRKQIPNKIPPYTMVLYASSPTKAIVGEATVETVLTRAVPDLIEKTVHRTPHTAADITEYFGERDEGHALRIVNPVRYEDPIPMDYLRETDVTIPQNFCYLEAQTHSKLFAFVN